MAGGFIFGKISLEIQIAWATVPLPSPPFMSLFGVVGLYMSCVYMYNVSVCVYVCEHVFLCMCVRTYVYVWIGCGEGVGKLGKLLRSVCVLVFVCMCVRVYVFLCRCVYVCVRVGEEEGSWGGYCGLISNQ